MKKKKQLKKTIEELALSVHEIKNLSELYNYIIENAQTKLEGNRLRRKILEYLEEFEVIVLDNQELIFHSINFSNAVFRVLLTDEEYADKAIYPGVQLMPYISPIVGIPNITIIDENEEQLKTKSIKMPLQVAYHNSVISLDEIFEEDNIDDEEEVMIMEVFDIARWMKKHYHKGQHIIFKTIDYANGVYQIFAESAAEFKREAFITKKADELLSQKIEEAFDYFQGRAYCEILINYAYHQLEPEWRSKPGTVYMNVIDKMDRFTPINYFGYLLIDKEHRYNYEINKEIIFAIVRMNKRKSSLIDHYLIDLNSCLNSGYLKNQYISALLLGEKKTDYEIAYNIAKKYIGEKPKTEMEKICAEIMDITDLPKNKKTRKKNVLDDYLNLSSELLINSIEIDILVRELFNNDEGLRFILPVFMEDLFRIMNSMNILFTIESVNTIETFVHAFMELENIEEMFERTPIIIEVLKDAVSSSRK